MNARVDELLFNGMSQRASAKILRLNRKTIVRKKLFLASLAQAERLNWLDARIARGELFASLQFDEMESFERSKCLPLSIPLVVDPETRKILSFRVGAMPAKGLLTDKSRKKYGKRRDERPRIVREVFNELKLGLTPKVRILSDRNPKYASWIRSVLPQARHRKVKGMRGYHTGQGELKGGGFDPLFALNHSAAMLRANVNRLFRRTWCTTKRADRLQAHMELYVRAHNREIDRRIEVEKEKKSVPAICG